MNTFIVTAALVVATATPPAVPVRESLVAASARSARVISVAPMQDSWNRVHALENGSSVRVIMIDGASAEGRLERVTDDLIVIRTANGPAAAEFRRDAIARVQRETRGSILGGVIGAAAGGLAGVATAVNLAYKDCGGDCTDEKALIGVSLAGMPIAGGYLGAKFFPRPRWTNVYQRR